jgi:hypothetical protein
MRPPDFSVIACLLSIVLTGCGVAGRTNRPLRLTLPLRYVEQSNLTIRMDNRRFTRLANGCSKKKVDSHGHMVALFFFYYNYGRTHSTLRVTPAMEAGLTDHVWSLEEGLWNSLICCSSLWPV